MIHTGTIPSFMENKLNKMKINEPTRYNQTMEFLNSFMVPSLKDVVIKKSIYNQYVSDLVTKIDNNIDNKNTKVHVFYALGIGNKIS